MNPITALITAAAVSALTTVICIAAIMLALGHVQNDRSTCFLDNPGHECALVWAPV